MNMYFYREKIPCIYGPGWEWGWVARPYSGVSYVIRDVDVPDSVSSASTYK